MIPTDPPRDGDVIFDPPPPDGDVRVDDITPIDVLPDEGPCTVGLTGSACSSVAQCQCIPSTAKQCVTTVGGYLTFPGGYCSATCTSDADCGTGGICATIGTAKYCLKQCSSASQCRMAEGYNCTVIPGGTDTRTFCLPTSPPDGGPG